LETDVFRHFALDNYFDRLVVGYRFDLDEF